MDADFPAAHSMDTEWFAVDADGQVGYFYSSESGAVPDEGQVQEPGRLWQRLCELVPRCEWIHDLQGYLDPGPRRDSGRHYYGDRGSDDGALMFLTSLAPVKRQINAGDAVPVRALDGEAVIFGRLTAALARRLHKQGHCLGCFFYLLREGTDQDNERRGRAAEIGLYDYRHPAENWIALPYGREMLPSRPLHIDELPPDLRDQVGQLRFATLRFADTIHIQPCATENVVCWESGYLTADGRTIRPIRGNYLNAEPSYEEFYQRMIGAERPWLKGITIDPPRPI
jgi:hypothetical protein